MKLYMHPVSMTSRPVRLFIAENKIPVDEQVVDLMTGEHYKEPYTAINPNRMVPMIDDDGFRLTESSAILKYLADKIGSPAYPKDLKQRAKVNEVMDWLNSNFYRDWGYGLCYPQLFPHHKRRSEEAHAGAIEWGQKNAQNWLRILNDHCGLFRRRPGHARRADRLRLLEISQRRALAQQHEEAAELGQDQRSVLRLPRLLEGQAVRRHLSNTVSRTRCIMQWCADPGPFRTPVLVTIPGPQRTTSCCALRPGKASRQMP
jgi:glutathione S-transferase